MANVNKPNGFRVRHDLMGYVPQVNTYFVPSGDNTAIYPGDLVIRGGSADATTGIGTAAQAAANGTILGVCVGVDNVRGLGTSMNLYRSHRPASTAMFIQVVDDLNVILEGQADDLVHTLVADDMQSNIDFIVGSGNATTATSGMQIDSSSVENTSTLPLTLIGPVPQPDNVPFTSNARYIVKINKHALANGSTGETKAA